MQTILLIDDHGHDCGALGTMLEGENFVPVLARDAESGFRQAHALKPQLLLVDLPLTGTNGVEMCRQLRDSGVRTPIIVLSATAGEDEASRVLDTGADDHLVKPFSARELLARIRAVMRRASADAAVRIRFGEVEVDTARRRVMRSGSEVELSAGEYRLLLFLLRNPNRALTREEVQQSVWGYEHPVETRTVDVHIGRLRRKLEPQPNAPRHILTIHGIGYRFRA